MTLRPPPALAVVVPCYDEEAVLPETARRLADLLTALTEAGRIAPDPAVYFVDDGSRDATWALIEGLNAADPRLRGIKLSRNRGHQNALMAGLAVAPGDAVVTIDADLQDDPGVIGAMVDAFRGGAEIVLGVRSDRTTDTGFKRVTGQGFDRVMSGLGVEIVHDHADFRLMGRAAITALAGYSESNLFLRALVLQLGFTVATVPYARAERFAGESKYPLGKMLAFALDGVTSFSTRPLRLITLLGFAVSTLAFALGLWALYIALFTTHSVPGWASTTVPIYLICGVQLLCLGIIGEYVGKIYFETKRRPRFVIERVLGPPGTPAG